MNSFKIPIERWKAVERDLKEPLEEIERHGVEFSVVEQKLSDAARRLRELNIGLPSQAPASARNTGHIPVPQVESLTYSKRHALGHDPDGYYDMRRRIGESYDTMRPSAELLRTIHRHVFGSRSPGGGEWKQDANYFPVYDADGVWIASQLKVPPGRVGEYVEGLTAGYENFCTQKSVAPLLSIAGYALDLFCIHPFWDGNGRVTRLMLLLLLHRSGYHIGRYVSFEGLIAERRVAYTGAIMASERGWSSAEHDPAPWCAFLIGVVRDAYRSFRDKTDSLAETADQLEALSAAIVALPRRFQTADLIKAASDVPESRARLLLNRLRHRGRMLFSLDENGVEWERPAPPDLSVQRK